MVTIIYIFATIPLLAFATEKYLASPSDNELKYGFIGYCAAWFSLLLGALPVYLLSIGIDKTDTWIGLFTLSPFGLWCFPYLLTVKYRFDENGIEVTSMVSPFDVRNWKYFQGMYFSPRSRAFILEFSYGDLNISSMLKNKERLISFMAEKGYQVE